MPVLEQIASQYPDVSFVGIAGRSNLEESRKEADRLGLDRIAWGYDEGLWDQYKVFGQPTGFLITADDKIYEGPWYRITDPVAVQEGLDSLLALHG
ncbi:MAG: hypothetical protein OEM22_04375 [Acidimicrobiia bacterium]|nr:hypothetical protein [Acidimicrobiia bacterium]MDH3471179.1 hypothetical protein [Acidimicrobiia bacterium]